MSESNVVQKLARVYEAAHLLGYVVTQSKAIEIARSFTIKELDSILSHLDKRVDPKPQAC